MKTFFDKFHQALEFEENDFRYDVLNKLDSLRQRGRMTETDFDILASMFNLHAKLPQVEHVLFHQGFILPTNEQIIGGSQKATWIYEKPKELRRLYRYEYESFETMWNRSDRTSFKETYEAGDLIAVLDVGDSSSDYGRIKEAHRHLMVKIKGDVVLEHKVER